MDWVTVQRRLKRNVEMSKTTGEEMPKRKVDGASPAASVGASAGE